jgi:class 3 adenylate cyclase/tetratricopeptide (TPR) repeat protein
MTSGGERSIERKVITALFCDLVGSTELGEKLDAEDVDRLLTTYHQLARKRIEAHGGTLEKFIGDAVVGLFGATLIHEDDPSRAVRAALAILRDIESTNLGFELRIGIQTGEAVVHIDDQRSPEEGIAVGDILNTAARLQGAAPEGGIAVGEPTYQRARSEFDWHDLGEIAMKGKAQPVQVWQPTGERSSTGQPTPESTPFLGREAELATLLDVFERAAAKSRIELVTIVAEPGLGKSRLVRELGQRVKQRPGVTWRSGRCLPYGDGVSFWALGEIVKSHAGILETDDQQTIGAKLDAALIEPDLQIRSWLRERLAPLVGLHTDAAPPEQAELFAAWTRFVIQLTGHGPVVLVVEDLHWADAALVDFVIQLADSAQEAPLLILVTARPEVAERHPAWLERAGRSTLVQLTSLHDDDIRAMVESTLAGASDAVIATVLERAAGSPLYAEQLAALAREQDLSTEGAAFDESMIPSTIQALLAARVDGLPKELKPVLLDASVIGRVFWSGAVADLEGRPRDEAEPALEDLARRELARHQDPSSMADENEYGFWHALLRDVAYSFLPRAARLAKHRAAAAWITERAGDRLGDLAEIVADHLRRAQDLATATGAEDELPGIRSDLASALMAAADHTMRIEPARAIGQLRNALDLLAPDDSRQPAALSILAAAHQSREESQEVTDVLAELARWHLDRGNELAAAELAVRRARALAILGRQPEADEVLEDARPILEAHPGPGLVEFLSWNASHLVNNGRDAEALEVAEEALQLAEELGLPRPYMALRARAAALSRVDVARADRDYLESVDLAMAAGDHRSALISLGGRAEIFELEHNSLVVAAFDDAIAFARRYGLAEGPLRANRLDSLAYVGRWDEVLDEAAALEADAMASGNKYSLFMIRMEVADIRMNRGLTPEPLDDLMAMAASIGFPPYVGGGSVARAALGRGESEAAAAAVQAALDAVPEGGWVTSVSEHVRVALAVGDVPLAKQALAKARRLDPPAPLTTLATALILEAEGDLSEASKAFADAEATFDQQGWPLERMLALMGDGRCLIAQGDLAGGVDRLSRAREIAMYLKAAPSLSEIDAAIDAAVDGPGGKRGR